MAERARLDHAVINVGFEMDRAQGLFENLGFSLTDRGYHSLGSINHLMMFGTDYLELIGLPPGTENPRPDIAQAPIGINGLVFKTSDVDATFAHLQAVGMDGDPPNAFTRPVTLPEGVFDASFRTVHVRRDVFPGGRVYYCEHGTPDLVWRPEWRHHGNGAQSMPEFVVVAAEPEGEAEKFARLLQGDAEGDAKCASIALAGGRISVMSASTYGERYGALASSMVGRASIFGAVVFRAADLDGIRGVLAKSDGSIAHIDEAERVVVREASFDSVLEFIA